MAKAYRKVNGYSVLTEALYFSDEYATRHRVLLAFTQLCHSTRQKFLPWLWEHVQPLYVRSPETRGLESHYLAEIVFQGQSRTLMANPSLTIYVK